MPDTATIFSKVLCPRCGMHVLNQVRCSWGCVPGMEYRVGERVQWLRSSSGSVIPSFKILQVAPKAWQWNCGGPEFSNVIVFDEDIYTGNHELECPSCKTRIAACVAVVRDGIFEKILALESPEVDRILGASLGRAHVAIVQADGSYYPREDWFDCPVEYIGGK